MNFRMYEKTTKRKYRSGDTINMSIYNTVYVRRAFVLANYVNDVPVEKNISYIFKSDRTNIIQCGRPEW